MATASNLQEGTMATSAREHLALPELALLDEILGRFSDALALVETAHSALDKPEEDETSKEAKVLTLRRGIDALKDVYTEFDLPLIRLPDAEGNAMSQENENA